MMTKEQIRAEVERQSQMAVAQSPEDLFEARTEFYFKLQGQPAESAGEASKAAEAPEPAESPVEDGEYQYSAGGSLGDTHIRSDGQWRVRRSDGSFRNTVWGDGALDAEVREGALKKIAPVRPAKTRGEEVAAAIVTFVNGSLAFGWAGYRLLVVSREAKDETALEFRNRVASIIDAERADAERQGAKKEREACLEIVDGIKPSSPGGDYSTGINRAVSDIHSAICARGEGQ